MGEQQRTLPGNSYYCTICASHLANDIELRNMFKPGDIAYYYPESIEIQDEIVLIGIIPISMTKPEMLAVPIAKLSFNEGQFIRLLKTIPGLYKHYLKVIRGADQSIGSKYLKHSEVYKKLKESCLSAQNAFEKEDDFEPEYVFEDENI